MPEALAIVFVVITSVVCYCAARLHARNPAVWNFHQELKRLEVRCAWLEHRLDTAARENWDGQMRRAVADELRSTRMQLAHMRAEKDTVVTKE